MLKYFNDLARYSNFKLPSLAMLEFDQKYFKKYVERLRNAQQVEIKWVRNSVVNETKKTLQNAFDESRKLLQDEIKNVLYNYDQLLIEKKALEVENLAL